MCFKRGEIRTEIIEDNYPLFSLAEKVGVTFQNLGCPVFINGLKVETGGYFPINVSNIILTNGVSIQFSEEINRKLVIGYIILGPDNQ